MRLYIFAFIALVGLNSWAVKVLQIGNSHTVQGFGEGLYTEIANNPKVDKARSIGLAGAAGRQWSSDNIKDRTLDYGYIDRPQMSKPVKAGSVEKLSTLLNQQKPDVLIVELADNFASYAATQPDRISKYAQKNGVSLGQAKAQIILNNNRTVESHVQMILDQIKAAGKKPSECFWVGPTWTEQENKPPVHKTNARAVKWPTS